MKRLLFLFVLLPLLSVAADIDPFSPGIAASKTITCGLASAATAFPTGVSVQNQVEVQNAGTAVVFVETGISTVTAAVATGYPILPGQSKIITVSSEITHIACISGTASQTVYVTIGRGM